MSVYYIMSTQYSDAFDGPTGQVGGYTKKHEAFKQVEADNG